MLTKTKTPAVYKDTKTNHFIYRYTIIENGKRTPKQKTFDTYQDAKTFKARQETKTTLKQAPKSTITLNEACELHIIRAKENQTLKPNTIYGYEIIINKIKNHPIGKMQVSDIKPSDIEDFIYSFRQTNPDLKATTLVRYRQFLGVVFKQLYIDGDILTNPIDRVAQPKDATKKFEITPWTLEECNKAFECLNNYHNQNVKTAVYLGIFSGLRRGEICGLKWENIDFDKNILTISETRYKIGGKVVDDTPKSQNSFRTITMQSQLSTVLKETYFKQSIITLKNGKNIARKTKPIYVICNYNTLEPISPTTLCKHFDTFIEKNKLRKIRFHDLRHTCGTLLCQAELPIKDISNYLGHGSIRTTENFYIHYKNPLNQKASEAMQNLFDTQQGKSP